VKGKITPKRSLLNAARKQEQKGKDATQKQGKEEILPKAGSKNRSMNILLIYLVLLNNHPKHPNSMQSCWMIL